MYGNGAGIGMRTSKFISAWSGFREAAAGSAPTSAASRLTGEASKRAARVPIRVSEYVAANKRDKKQRHLRPFTRQTDW